jgi:hypothetical protein
VYGSKKSGRHRFRRYVIGVADSGRKRLRSGKDGCAHPLEKSGSGFVDVSIHSLPNWWVSLRKVDASSLRERSS